MKKVRSLFPDFLADIPLPTESAYTFQTQNSGEKGTKKASHNHHSQKSPLLL
jgi:hypothetical protein